MLLVVSLWSCCWDKHVRQCLAAPLYLPQASAIGVYYLQLVDATEALVRVAEVDDPGAGLVRMWSECAPYYLIP